MELASAHVTSDGMQTSLQHPTLISGRDQGWFCGRNNDSTWTNPTHKLRRQVVVLLEFC